jgi:hypothetical protein
MELDCPLAPNNAFADTAFRFGRPEASPRNAFARPRRILLASQRNSSIAGTWRAECRCSDTNRGGYFDEASVHRPARRNNNRVLRPNGARGATDDDDLNATYHDRVNRSDGATRHHHDDDHNARPVKAGPPSPAALPEALEEGAVL